MVVKTRSPKCERSSASTSPGQARPPVDHRQQDPRDAEARVEPPLDEVDRAEELREPLQREVLRLDGHEDAIRGGERVHGQRAERRRAVEEDEGVVVRRGVGEGVGEVALAALERGEVDRRRRELGLRRHEVDVREGARGHELRQRRAVEEVERRVAVRAPPEAGRRVRLRVEIDEEAALSRLGKARGEVDRGGRLADAALLVRDRVDPGRHGVTVPARPDASGSEQGALAMVPGLHHEPLLAGLQVAERGPRMGGAAGHVARAEVLGGTARVGSGELQLVRRRLEQQRCGLEPDLTSRRRPWSRLRGRVSLSSRRARRSGERALASPRPCGAGTRAASGRSCGSRGTRRARRRARRRSARPPARPGRARRTGRPRARPRRLRGRAGGTTRPPSADGRAPSRPRRRTSSTRLLLGPAPDDLEVRQLGRPALEELALSPLCLEQRDGPLGERRGERDAGRPAAGSDVHDRAVEARDELDARERVVEQDASRLVRVADRGEARRRDDRAPATVPGASGLSRPSAAAGRRRSGSARRPRSPSPPRGRP